MQKLLILCALKEELPPEHNPYKDIPHYTGVGKVNATIQSLTLARSINPSIIVNFGTAGACDRNISGLVECGTFLDRDDSSKFEEFSNNPISNEGSADNPNMLTISTGDNFVTSPLDDCDVVDMEAYAIAKVCQLRNIHFKCFKYITDYVDKNSSKDWYQNISKGYSMFLQRINNDYYHQNSA